MEEGGDLREGAQPAAGAAGEGVWVKCHHNGEEDMRALLFFVVGERREGSFIDGVRVTSSLPHAPLAPFRSTQSAMHLLEPPSTGGLFPPSKRSPMPSGLSFPTKGES